MIIANFLRSGIPLQSTSTHAAYELNTDSPTWGPGLLNPQVPAFVFPEPLRFIETGAPATHQDDWAYGTEKYSPEHLSQIKRFAGRLSVTVEVDSKVSGIYATQLEPSSVHAANPPGFCILSPEACHPDFPYHLIDGYP